MKLLRGKYLVEEVKAEVKQEGQLYLFDSTANRNFKTVRVLRIPPGEEDIAVGEILKVSQGAGQLVDCEGDVCMIVTRNDIFYIGE